jgi:flagellar hook assembly protein FlgD
LINITSIEGFVIVYDFTSPVSEEETASTFAITGVAPNPFAGTTTIGFNVVNASKVAVDIYDAIGNRVATVADDVFTSGKQSVQWDGTSSGVSLPSGTYTVRISDGTNTATQQVVVIR